MAETLADLPRVAEEALGEADLDRRLKDERGPFVVRGLAAHWPLVKEGLKGAKAARAYLVAHHRDRPFAVNIGERGGGERIFYRDDMGMNFRSERGALPELFARIDAGEGDPDAPLIYFSSVDLHDYFDGLAEANRLDLGGRQPLTSIWIGTRTRIAAHNDVPDNLAVCAVGRRRFTLFPPDQLANLYLGPLENTPAGRPVSMVDLAEPDFAAHPRLREALDHALVAELEPGDAIFVPSLWWHHVEGLAPFNVLVNYWWRDEPRWLGQPEDALHHAILAIRDLPEEAREQWCTLFDHYIFRPDGSATDHLPPGKRGILDPLTAATAAQIRAHLLRSLSG